MNSPFTLQATEPSPVSLQSPEETEATKRFFLGHRPIGSQLPIVFADGQECTEYFGVCKGCKAEIGGDHLRGKVTELIAEVHKIEAVALCEHCHLLTRSLARVRVEEGNIQLELRADTGDWLKASAPKGIMARIRSFLSR